MSTTFSTHQLKIPQHDGMLATAFEYYNLKDDGFRYELLEGRLVALETPPIIHQRLLVRLIVEIGNFLSDTPIGELLCAPFNVQFNEENVYQPDIIFVKNEKRHIITKERIIGAPDLVAEILSANTTRQDKEIKFKNYARSGVKEYWIIHPNTAECHFYKLSGTDFLEVLPKKNQYVSDILVGFVLDLNELKAFIQQGLVS